MAKFCENCGFALEPGSSFCPNCGSPVPVEPKNEEQPEVREEEQAEQIEERVEGQIEEQTEEQAAELTAGPAGDDAPLPPAREETPEAQPAHFSGFCGMCGSPLDPATGECPVCSARREMNVPAQEQPPVYTAPPAPPYQPAPDYRTAPKAPKKAGKPKKKKSKGRGAVVILLFILFVVLSLVCLSLFIARNTASEKSMERILKPVSYNDFTESVGSDVSGQVEDMYKGVDEKLEPYGISTTITDESFAEFIDGSNVRSLIAEKASGLVDGILSDGDVTVRLTRSEAGDFLEENKALIKEKLGVDIDESIEAHVYDEFYGAYSYENIRLKDKMIDSIVGESDRVFFDGEEIRGENETAFNVSRIILSYPVMIALAAVCLVLAVLMIILRPGMGTAILGVYFVVIGLPLTLGCLGGLIMPGVFASATGNPLFGKIIAGALRVNLPIGAAVLGAGVVLLVLRGVVKGVSKKKNAARAA